MIAQEEKFYAHLGQISVKFAQIDALLAEILAKLIGSDEDLISETLIEDNSISKNIEIIKKINRIRSFNEPLINDLIKKIGTIRKVRNLFIHGIWTIPFESEGELKIVCSTRKITYKEEKDTKGVLIEKTWRHSVKQVFKLQDLTNYIRIIDEIQEIENIIIENLDTENLNL
jgi:hypothetical protein